MDHIYTLSDLTIAPITLQQIIAFLTVAETASFSKASAPLHMTQSAVSKSIAKLEKELNIALFTRTTREICLTEAGQLLHEEWKKQLLAINSAYAKALSLQSQNASTLRIGILNTARPERYFFQMEEAFCQKFPHISLNLEIEYMTYLESRLMEGHYDAIMLPDFQRFSIEEKCLSWKWAARGHACVIIPRSNPLSQRESLLMEDLLQQDFVSLSSAHSPHFLRDLRERFAPYGVEPHIHRTFKNAFDVKYLFRSDHDILFADQYFDFEDTADFVRVPIIDQLNGIICAWNPDNFAPALAHFLEMLPIDSW